MHVRIEGTRRKRFTTKRQIDKVKKDLQQMNVQNCRKDDKIGRSRKELYRKPRATMACRVYH